MRSARAACGLLTLFFSCFLCVGYARAGDLIFSSRMLQAEPYHTVQVQTLSYEHSARRCAERLRRKGYPAYIAVFYTSSGEPLYKIRFGRYRKHEQASRAAAAYSRQENKECIIVRSSIKISLESEKKSEADGPAAADAAYEKPARPPSMTAKKAAAEQKDEQDKTNTDRMDARTADAIDERGEFPGYDKAVYYTIQVSTKLALEPAEKLVRKIRRRGYQPYICTYETSSGKMLYKVRIGAFETRAQAERTAQRYERIAHEPYIIVRSRWHPGDYDTDSTSSRGNLQQADADTPEQPLQPDKKAAAPPNPQLGRVTRIYAYRGGANELHLTNKYENIPVNLHNAIEYISIFPVSFVEASPGSPCATVIIDKKEHAIRLAGLRLLQSGWTTQAHTYFEQELTHTPLRLKYSPEYTSRENRILGRLFFKDGTCVNVDMLRKGLAAFEPDTAPAGEKKSYREAFRRARQEKAGLWKGRSE